MSPNLLRLLRVTGDPIPTATSGARTVQCAGQRATLHFWGRCANLGFAGFVCSASKTVLSAVWLLPWPRPPSHSADEPECFCLGGVPGSVVCQCLFGHDSLVTREKWRVRLLPETSLRLPHRSTSDSCIRQIWGGDGPSKVPRMTEGPLILP